MKKPLVFLFLVMIGMMPVSAQNNESFQDYRKRLLNDYADFRQSLLDNYDKYLESIWREYDAFRGVQRDTVPKPVKAPVAHPDIEPPVQKEPDPIVEVSPVPDTIVIPAEERPEPLLKALLPAQKRYGFDFYGMYVEVPKVDVGACPSQMNTGDYAVLWRQFRQKEVNRRVVPALQQAAAAYRLNDWFVFQMVRDYVASCYASSVVPLRIALEHFLLCHLGYNVRLAQDKAGRPMLLVALKQMVYAHAYAKINGQRFYIYRDSLTEREDMDVLTFYTCELPVDAEAGRPLDLSLVQAPLVPYKAHHYYIGVDGLTIHGELNANLMPLLYRYPQMDVECYAYSMLCPDVRKTVVAQLREQLEGLPRLQAINMLLQFVQYAFDYATDPKQHGFEKPYFFEEILFYPKCDCEDRSVFYSYLLWEVLGVENQLVFFPGHACVAVRLDESVEGTSYLYKGSRFYISDPTFIGAVTGECMPDYLHEHPDAVLSR